MTCDCLSRGRSHPQHRERKQEKGTSPPCFWTADERVETPGGKERESSFVSESRDVCGRVFLTEDLLCGCGRSGDHEAPVLRHAVSDWLLGHR